MSGLASGSQGEYTISDVADWQWQGRACYCGPAFRDKYATFSLICCMYLSNIGHSKKGPINRGGLVLILADA